MNKPSCALTRAAGGIDEKTENGALDHQLGLAKGKLGVAVFAVDAYSAFRCLIGRIVRVPRSLRGELHLMSGAQRSTVESFLACGKWGHESKLI